MSWEQSWAISDLSNIICAETKLRNAQKQISGFVSIGFRQSLQSKQHQAGCSYSTGADLENSAKTSIAKGQSPNSFCHRFPSLPFVAPMVLGPFLLHVLYQGQSPVEVLGRSAEALQNSRNNRL